MDQVLRPENGPRRGSYVKYNTPRTWSRFWTKNLVQILDQELRPFLNDNEPSFAAQLVRGGTRLAATNGGRADAHRTDVCLPVLHRVSPSKACHANTQVCDPCLTCRYDAVTVCETCASTRRDDMVVEGVQEHARPCGAMTSAGHVYMIAHPHVCTSCVCIILPLASYTCVCVCISAQNIQHTVTMHESDIQHRRVLNATI